MPAGGRRRVGPVGSGRRRVCRPDDLRLQLPASWDRPAVAGERQVCRRAPGSGGACPAVAGPALGAAGARARAHRRPGGAHRRSRRARPRARRRLGCRAASGAVHRRRAVAARAVRAGRRGRAAGLRRHRCRPSRHRPRHPVGDALRSRPADALGAAGRPGIGTPCSGAGPGSARATATRDRCDPVLLRCASTRCCGGPGTVGARSRGYGGVMTEPFPPEPLPTPPSPAPPEPPSPPTPAPSPGPADPRARTSPTRCRPSRDPTCPSPASPDSPRARPTEVGIVHLLTGSRRSGQSLPPDRGAETSPGSDLRHFVEAWAPEWSCPSQDGARDQAEPAPGHASAQARAQDRPSRRPRRHGRRRRMDRLRPPAGTGPPRGRAVRRRRPDAGRRRDQGVGRRHGLHGHARDPQRPARRLLPRRLLGRPDPAGAGGQGRRRGHRAGRGRSGGPVADERAPRGPRPRAVAVPGQVRRR